MAQPIYCDFPDCQDPEAPRSRVALWMLQKLDGTTIEAWCALHWPLAAIVSAQEQAELNGTSLAELLAPAPPEPDEPTDEDEEPGVTADAFPEPAQRPQTADTPAPGSSPPNEAQEAVPTALEPEPSPKVIRRGTSPSRRAHEARKRARARKAPAPEPADEPELSSAAAEGD